MMKHVLFFIMPYLDHLYVGMPILKILRDAGYRVTLVGYNTIQFFPSDVIKELGLEFLTISDKGPDSITPISRKQYIQLCGNDIDFPACMIQEYFANDYPVEHDWIFQDSPHFQRYYGTAYRIEQIIKSCSPDFVINPHGSENFSKLIYAKSIKCGIPVLCYESPFFQGKFLLDSEGMHFFPGKNLIDKNWDQIRNTELSSEKKTALQRYLGDWHGKKKSKYKQITDESESNSVSQIKSSGKKILFFPGQVPWDANVLTSLGKFESYEQIIETLCDNLPEDWIIIHKVHPKNTASQMEKGWLSKNCFVVENMNIHDLISMSDACCVLSSNVGMEALIYKKPIICLGRPYYSCKGLTLDWNTDENFPALLQKSLTFKPDGNLLERFLYYLVFEYLIDEGDMSSLLQRLNQAKENIVPPVENAAPFIEFCPDRMKRYLELITRYNQLAAQGLSYEEIDQILHLQEKPQQQEPTPWFEKILIKFKSSSQTKRDSNKTKYIQEKR